ncbi:hypothetical protein GIB67_001942, partial [Kingdonia uniflora]
NFLLRKKKKKKYIYIYIAYQRSATKDFDKDEPPSTKIKDRYIYIVTAPNYVSKYPLKFSEFYL